MRSSGQNAGMSEDTPQELDRRKVRIGLAIISAIVLVSLVLVAVVDSAFGKAVMFAIAAMAFLRLFLLTRSIRRGS